MFESKKNSFSFFNEIELEKIPFLKNFLKRCFSLKKYSENFSQKTFVKKIFPEGIPLPNIFLKNYSTTTSHNKTKQSVSLLLLWNKIKN